MGTSNVLLGVGVTDFMFKVTYTVRFGLLNIKVCVLWPSKPYVFLVGTHIAKKVLFKYR